MSDLISRQAAIDALEFGITYAKVFNKETGEVKELFSEANEELRKAVERIKQLPSAQPETFTDKEQRIFLAAMGREEQICEEVDRNYVREPYEDSLMLVCREIKRKVKDALWI